MALQMVGNAQPAAEPCHPLISKRSDSCLACACLPSALLPGSLEGLVHCSRRGRLDATHTWLSVLVRMSLRAPASFCIMAGEQVGLSRLSNHSEIGV